MPEKVFPCQSVCNSVVVMTATVFAATLKHSLAQNLDAQNDQSQSVQPPTSATQPVVSASTTNSSLSKPGMSSSNSLLANVDKGMLLRMMYVLLAMTFLIGLYFGIKMCRLRKKRQVRRYDILSAKQLQPELVVDSEDSEDEIFADDSQATRLVKQGSGDQR